MLRIFLTQASWLAILGFVWCAPPACADPTPSLADFLGRPSRPAPSDSSSSPSDTISRRTSAASLPRRLTLARSQQKPVTTVNQQSASGPEIGDALTTFGDPFTAQVKPNARFGDISSTSALGTDALGSTATILEGTNASLATQTIRMSWRKRTAGEQPQTAQHPLLPNGIGYLASDVVNIDGVPSPVFSKARFLGHPPQSASDILSSISPFALQMDYSPELEGWEDALRDAKNATLYLAWLDLSDPAVPMWKNAVEGNLGLGRYAQTNVHMSYLEFRNANKNRSLADLLGSWGVDTETNTVWAVVNRTGQFAVVPEPGTLALLAVSGLVIWGALWRRRRGG